MSRTVYTDAEMIADRLERIEGVLTRLAEALEAYEVGPTHYSWPDGTIRRHPHPGPVETVDVLEVKTKE